MLLASACGTPSPQSDGDCDGGLATSVPVDVRVKLSSLPGGRRIPEREAGEAAGASPGRGRGGEKRWEEWPPVTPSGRGRGRRKKGETTPAHLGAADADESAIRPGRLPLPEADSPADCTVISQSPNYFQPFQLQQFPSRLMASPGLWLLRSPTSCPPSLGLTSPSALGFAAPDQDEGGSQVTF